MRMHGLISAVVCTAVLAGCAAPALQIPREVKVAVATPCIDARDRPVRPHLLTEGELLALDSYRRTWALWAEWLQLRLYVGELEPIIEACSKIPTGR